MEGLPIVVALDIEGRGPSAIRNGIVSIGVGIVDPDPTRPAARYRFDVAPYEGQTMDPATWEGFWMKHQDVFNTLTANPQPPSVAMAAFRLLLDNLEVSSKGAGLYIVSDAPSYDYTFVNYYLDREGHKMLHFTSGGDFRPVHDADSYARGVCGNDIGQQWVNTKEVCKRLGVAVPPNEPDHSPENDALFILHSHLSIVQGGMKKK